MEGQPAMQVCAPRQSPATEQKWVVSTLHEVLRPMDSLGRLGGDEFAILVPGAGPVEGQEVAQRVNEKWRHCGPSPSGSATSRLLERLTGGRP